MPDKEHIDHQMEIAKEGYENLVEEHGFVRGTIKYYKQLLGGG
jgi:hypothetical protein